MSLTEVRLEVHHPCHVRLSGQLLTNSDALVPVFTDDRLLVPTMTDRLFITGSGSSGIQSDRKSSQSIGV